MLEARTLRRLSVTLATVGGVLALGACDADAPATPSDAPQSVAVGSLASLFTSNTGALIVTEGDVARQLENSFPTKAWVLYNRAGTDPSAAVFEVGPSTVPEGVGSLRLQTIDGNKKTWLFNYDYVGTPLSSITAIGYSTYRTQAPAGSPAVAGLNIEVDFNGPDVAGGYTVLVFEPYIDQGNAALVDNTWQTWDAFRSGQAKWWTSQAINGFAQRAVGTWNDILAANPDAVILGGVGINQGSGNGGVTSNVDALTFGVSGTTKVYDLEPFVTPTTRETCREEGWQVFKRPDGSSFKNQGDCVSYVQTGK